MILHTNCFSKSLIAIVESKCKNFKIADIMWHVKLYQNYPNGLKISFFIYLRSLMMIINVKL